MIPAEIENTVAETLKVLQDSTEIISAQCTYIAALELQITVLTDQNKELKRKLNERPNPY